MIRFSDVLRRYWPSVTPVAGAEKSGLPTGGAEERTAYSERKRTEALVHGLGEGPDNQGRGQPSQPTAKTPVALPDPNAVIYDDHGRIVRLEPELPKLDGMG